MRNSFMSVRRVPLVALGVALAFPLVALAQVYKWIDDKGVTNYSSTPPDNRKSEKLDEDKGRVSTIEAYDASKGDAGRREQALKDRVARLEEDAQRNRQTAAAQDVASAEAYRQWRERCIADRRTDCDSPYPTAYDPGYYSPYGPYGIVRPGARPVPQQPVPGMYQPTPFTAVGAGGVAGPYYRSPPGGLAVGPGPAGIGAGLVPAPPGGVVVTPGPAGIGSQYRPVPEDQVPSAAPRPRPRQ